VQAYSVYTLAFIAQLLFGFDTLAQIQKVLTAKYTKDTSVPLQLSQDQLSRAASAVAFLLLVLNSLLPVRARPALANTPLAHSLSLAHSLTYTVSHTHTLAAAIAFLLNRLCSPRGRKRRTAEHGAGGHTHTATP
jgi:hypothetical protein